MSGRMERFWLLSQQFSWGFSSRARFVPLRFVVNISKSGFLAISHPSSSHQIKSSSGAADGMIKCCFDFLFPENSAAISGRWRRGNFLGSFSLCPSFSSCETTPLGILHELLRARIPPGMLEMLEFESRAVHWIFSWAKLPSLSVHLWVWKFPSGGHWGCSSSQIWLSFVDLDPPAPGRELCVRAAGDTPGALSPCRVSEPLKQLAIFSFIPLQYSLFFFGLHCSGSVKFSSKISAAGRQSAHFFFRIVWGSLILSVLSFVCLNF